MLVDQTGLPEEFFPPKYLPPTKEVDTAQHDAHEGGATGTCEGGSTSGGRGIFLCW